MTSNIYTDPGIGEYPEEYPRRKEDDYLANIERLFK